MLSFSKNPTCLTVFLNGVLHTVPSDSPNFRAVWGAIKANDEALVEKTLNVVEAVAEAFESVVGTGIAVSDAGVFHNGRLMHNALSSKIMEFMAEGIPFMPLVKFLENFLLNPVVQLINNPEARALASNLPTLDQFTDDFYSFLDHKNMPITEDGHFLAYKSVQSDYYSKYSGSLIPTKGKVRGGKIYNAPGEEIECDRKEVDPSRIAECSYGLHVGCLDYSGPNGWYHSASDKIVIVKVNPRDVVAVPPGYNRTKMRVCAYVVLQDFQAPLQRPAYRADYEDEDFDLYNEDYEYGDDEYETTGDLDSPSDLFIDDEIRFTYTKDTEVATRYLNVTELIKDSITGELARVTGILLEPEADEGQYRTFKAERISDIQLIYKG